MRRAQADALRGVMFIGSWSKLVPLVLPIGLAACASGNILKHAEVDRSIVTGSVPSAEPSAANATDEDTIRNAATSVDPSRLGPNGLAWTNPTTGASGQITGVTEFQDNGHLCRRFSTSLTRFDGVGLFHGEACMEDDGGWRLQTLAGS